MGKSRPKHLPDELHYFPNRNKTNHAVTSDRTDSHNCIAFAAGDYDHNWWPRKKTVFVPWIGEIRWENQPRYMWPEGCDEDETIEAFIQAFGTKGFKKCKDGEDGSFEKGIQKIALYAKTGADGKLSPTHAAVQTRQGKWRSKLSADHDIEHTLEALEGSSYGTVALFLSKEL
jgi:hypothetical protein